jgi:hypothetical protein
LLTIIYSNLNIFLIITLHKDLDKKINQFQDNNKT